MESFGTIEPKLPLRSPAPQIEDTFRRYCDEASAACLFNDEKGEGLFPALLLDALRCYARQTELPRDVDLVGA